MPYAGLLKGRHSEPGREYFITTVVAGRKPLLKQLRTVCLLVDALKATETKDNGQWQAWVAIPDHFHGLLSLGENAALSHFMQRFKGRSAYAINQQLDRSGAFWQPSYYYHALRRKEDRRSVARYIVANPLRKGSGQQKLAIIHIGTVSGCKLVP